LQWAGPCRRNIDFLPAQTSIGQAAQVFANGPKNPKAMHDIWQTSEVSKAMPQRDAFSETNADRS
jgi:hypothetical protein